MNSNMTKDCFTLIYILAQQEAKNTGCDQVLPEHVLIALIKNKDNAGYKLLQDFNIDFDCLLTMLEDSLISKPIEVPIEVLPNSRRLGTMIDLSGIEAQALGENLVDTEHLVLGAARENDSILALFLGSCNIFIKDLRNKVKENQLNKNNEKSNNKDKFDTNPKVNKKNNSNKESKNKNSESIFTDFILNEMFNENNKKIESKLNDIIGNSDSHSNQKKRSNNEESSFFAEYSRDITKLAREDKTDPVVGRDKEIHRIIQILSRRTKNNPILIGEPGVGKTAIVEGLAQKIAKNDVPRDLLKKRILSLDLTALIAGTRYRGEFEERMKRLMKEVREDKNIILFIDELHTIIGAGGPEGSLDASNILKPALSRGEIQIIGATTTKEYNMYIEKDSALERRFQSIKVDEPSDADTVGILTGIKKKYEDFHGVIYDNDVIPAIVKLTKRYIPERCLPDKAIDLLDEVGAAKKIQDDFRPEELIGLEEKIDELVQEKKDLVLHQDYEQAAIVRDKVIELKNRLELYRNAWKNNSETCRQRITSRDVCKIVAEMTGIPVEQLDSSESKRLVKMEDELHKSIIGQNEAVRLISSAVRRNRSGISSPNHPIGSFIFLGPTGVGKTQLAKSLAKFLFGSEDKLIRVDMSDYMEKHNASRLVGAPPGYVGYEDGGVLTEKVRRNPYSVVLLDEIEKAHPDIFNLLLQLLEEGELSDNLGHTVNFRNTVIIMTSNAGARQITTESRVGFNFQQTGVLSYEEIRASAMNELKKILNPELLNRIDDTIVFNALSRDEVSQILDIQLNDLSNRLKEIDLSLFLTDSARDYLIEHGYEPAMGARPMRRLIQKEIEDSIAMAILDGSKFEQNQICVDCVNNKLSVNFDRNNEEHIRCFSNSIENSVLK